MLRTISYDGREDRVSLGPGNLVPVESFVPREPFYMINETAIREILSFLEFHPHLKLVGYGNYMCQNEYAIRVMDKDSKKHYFVRVGSDG